MNATSIGDLAQGLVLRSRGAALSQEIGTLTRELSSGLVSDVSRRVGGDYAVLADINARLTRIAGYESVTRETAFFAEAMQSSLEAVQTLSGSMAGDLISAVSSNLPAQRAHVSGLAQGHLERAIGLLNGAAAGRSLFSGAATDTPALADAQTLMSALRTEVAGLTAASDIQAAIGSWFSAPGGFQSVMYQGAAQDIGSVRVGETERVTFAVKADAGELRQVLRHLATAALADDATLGLDADTRTALLSGAGQGLIAAGDGLTHMRADLGFVQSRIDEAAARNAATRLGLETTQSRLLAADPYETATRLEQAQFQLESLYAVTVRSSQLSLLRFMS